MLVEVTEEKGEKGEEWQQEGVGEVLEDAEVQTEEEGLVGQGEEGEELQEEGEVAVATKELRPQQHFMADYRHRHRHCPYTTYIH